MNRVQDLKPAAKDQRPTEDLLVYRICTLLEKNEATDRIIDIIVHRWDRWRYLRERYLYQEIYRDDIILNPLSTYQRWNQEIQTCTELGLIPPGRILGWDPIRNSNFKQDVHNILCLETAISTSSCLIENLCSLYGPEAIKNLPQSILRGLFDLLPIHGEFPLLPFCSSWTGWKKKAQS